MVYNPGKQNLPATLGDDLIQHLLTGELQAANET